MRVIARIVLLVIMVPRIVPPKYVPTALGAHKSVESAGSTISVTIAGMILDRHLPKKGDPTSKALLPRPGSFSLGSVAAALAGMGPGAEQKLEIRSGASAGLPEQGAVWTILFGFFIGNALQLVCVLWLWRVDRRRRAKAVLMALRESVAVGAGEGAPVLDRRYTAPGVVERDEEDEDGEGGEGHGHVATLSPGGNEIVIVSSSEEDGEEDEEDVEAGRRKLDALGIPSGSGAGAGRYRTLSMHSDTPLIGAHAAAAPSYDHHPESPRSRGHSASPPGSRRHSHSLSGARHPHHSRSHSHSRSHRHSRSHSHSHSHHHSHHSPSTPSSALIIDGLTLPAPSRATVRRGKMFFVLCGVVIFGAWSFYVGTLIRDLRRRGRGE